MLGRPQHFNRPESAETVISFLPPIYCICIYMTFIEDNALDRCGRVLTVFLFFLLKKNLQNEKKKEFLYS